MKKITENVKLAGYDELFRATQEDLADSKESQVVEIPLEELYEFKNHPFKVLDDEKMDETVDSIKNNGVLVPGMARRRTGGGYEIISGHRRKRACELAGLKTMPFVIKELTDDEATILMVDSNIQREVVLVSEKARAYKQKFDAEKHQGSKGNTLQSWQNRTGENAKTIQRFIWIARLLDELLEFVDEKKLGFCQGVDISFLTEEEQAWVLLVIKIGQINISLKQSQSLKKLSQEHMLNFEMVQEILTKKEVFTRKFSMDEKKLSQYFDQKYTTDDIEKIIIELLEKWKKGR